MNKMKVLALLVAVLMIAVAFAACSTPSTETPSTESSEAPSQSAEASEEASETVKTIKIGATYQMLAAPYIVTLKDSCVATAEAMGGIELIVVDGEGDPAKQVGQVENFIAQKCDVIILDPQSFDGCAPAVDAANAAGIPIFTLIQKVENQDEAITYVGSEAKESGEILAQMAVDDFGGNAKVVVIEGPMGSDAQIGRYSGIEAVMNANAGMELVMRQAADWDRATALALVENWLQSGMEFDVVLAENDDMAMGALKAIEDLGMLDKIKVYGIDAIPEALTAVQEGKMGGTVFQDAVAQGKLAIEVAVKIAEGKEKIESSYVIPYVEVRAADVPKYQ